MRLAFAVAAHLDPEVLLLDEIFAVGDEAFQAKCRQTMRQFIDQGRTVVFVSHSADAVAQVCSRVCVLSGGRKVFDGGYRRRSGVLSRTSASRTAIVSLTAL